MKGVSIMQIVTDSGADLSESQRKGLSIYYAPLRITLSGKSYEGENELSSADFYKLLSETEDYPTTSQASAGDFAKIYQSLAKKGEKILSIHISSGLSGTLNSEKVGAAMVPEADVTFWDSKTLSAGLGLAGAGCCNRRRRKAGRWKRSPKGFH